MKATKDKTSVDMPCTSRAIRAKLRNPKFEVLCLIGGTGYERWEVIQNVRFNDGPTWRGLWVQECGGLAGWHSPKAARYRATNNSTLAH